MPTSSLSCACVQGSAGEAQAPPGGGDPAAMAAAAAAAGAAGGRAGGAFSLEVMEGLLKDPKMQEAMYQYLPESMRNKETFDWMMSNPEYRKQLQEMMSKQVSGLWCHSCAAIVSNCRTKAA